MDPKALLEQQWLAGIQLRCVSVELSDCWVHLYFYDAPNKPDFFASESKLLQESKKQNLGNGYSITFDRNNYSLEDRSKDHLHFFLNGKKLGAINRDGTAHDRSHGVRIPNHVADFIKTSYPDFQIPSNNIIESVDQTDEELTLFLIEENIRRGA
jgi:hypothetical protein